MISIFIKSNKRKILIIYLEFNNNSKNIYIYVSNLKIIIKISLRKIYI